MRALVSCVSPGHTHASPGSPSPSLSLPRGHPHHSFPLSTIPSPHTSSVSFSRRSGDFICNSCRQTPWLPPYLRLVAARTLSFIHRRTGSIKLEVKQKTVLGFCSCRRDRRFKTLWKLGSFLDLGSGFLCKFFHSFCKFGAMDAVCIDSGASRTTAAFRSFRQVPSTFRALRIVALALQSIVVWIVFICRFKYVRVASSPVFESIEVEEEEEACAMVSVETSRSSRRAWARSSSCDAACRRVLAHKLRLVKPINEKVSSWQTHLFLNSRRQTLFAQSWMPAGGKEMKGLLVLLHGLNEHSGRYLHFAMQLNLQGYGVYAMDWIGHGGSDGLHGYVASLDYVVADTKAFLRWVADRNPDVPCFLFGHSTGGAVALKTAFHFSAETMLKGIILTSPALRVRPSHPVFGVIAPVFSILFPTLQFSGAHKRGIPVSRDPAQLAAKYSDPLVYTGPLRIRTGSEILRITAYLQRNMKKITVPFLVMHGTADRVTDPFASRDLYHCAASKYKRLKLYDGFLHDLLFEPEREEITEDIINWMDEMINTLQVC